MTVVSAFEREKNALRERLMLCNTVEESIAVVQRTMEQIAVTIAQDTEEDTARQRSQAVLAVYHAAPKLISACTAKGELVITQDQSTGIQKAVSKVPLAGGIVLLAVAAYEALAGQITPALVTVIGAMMVFGAKRMEMPGTRTQARGVVSCDADRLVAALLELCRAADTCLADLEAVDRESRIRLGASADDALLSLLESLMEAKLTGREELAQQSLTDAEQYLRLMGIDAKTYSPEDRAMFEVLPTVGEERTLRPALVKDGKVLRRGVAVSGNVAH